MSRALLLQIHRWLGLTSAIVLAIAGVTGIPLVVALEAPWAEPWAEFHETLGAGVVGRWVVFAASAAALGLQGSGLLLWWPPQRLRLRLSRGWWRCAYDVHNLSGIVTLPMTGLLAGTAVGRVLFETLPTPAALDTVHRVVGRLHSASGFPAAVKALYLIGSIAFVVQAISGVFVWWRPTAAAPRAAAG